MNWGIGKTGSNIANDLNLDFSKMNSTTLFSIALLAVLVILLIVLVIVTIKVLSKGKKESDEEYTERTYTSNDAEDEEEDEDVEEDRGSKKKDKKSKKDKKKEKKAAERAERESGDGDEDEDEEDEDDRPEESPEKQDSRDEVAAVVEAALQAKAKAAELEARVAKEKAQKAAEEAEMAARKASEAEAEAKAASRAPVEEEEEEASYDEEPEEAPEESEEDDEEESDEDDEDDEEEFGHTDEIPVARVRAELKKQEEAEAEATAEEASEKEDILTAKTQVANADQIVEAVKAARSGKKPEIEEDSAFGENAFAVEEEDKKTLDTTFDSAFLGDSAFAEPAAEEDGEEIHSLQVAGETITVNPVNAVNIHTVNAAGPVQTTNPEAGINDPSEMSEFLSDNPVPKKEKKKMKKRDAIFAKKFDEDAPKIEGGRFLWYNNQDIEALTKKEDMYYYCHYFDDPTEAVLPLIIEMYDCAFVRTEEIQKIAYGINYKSMGLREILTSKDDVSFDRSKITKEPTDQDLLQIRAKWVDYVDNFLQIIVIKAPAHMQEYIREQLYAYGENDVETLLFCPEPEDEEE